MKFLQKKYALSKQGARDLLKGILYSVLEYISLMLPVALLACVLNVFLEPLLGGSRQETNIVKYILVGIVVLVIIFVMHYIQYTITYMGTYQESERRRITLAEKLRTMPLRFFKEHDVSDLTGTIMGDCAGFEHAFSHTVPQFWGSIISTAIVCIALLVYDWRMGLALLWVAPVAFAVVLLSRKLQTKQGQKHIEAKLALADGIQECLETVPDIKACNLETEYLKKLDKKMEAAEKSQLSSEMLTASLVTCGQMFLRLGLATVIVVGNVLLLHEETTLFSYILFLIAASRLYDPLSGAMTNMENLETANYEDGTYYYADVTEDGLTIIVNTVFAKDVDTDVKELENYLTGCALNLVDSDLYEVVSVSQDTDLTANFSYPVYIVEYTVGANEDTRKWTVFAMDTDFYTYLYGFCTTIDAAEDMEEIYQDIFTGLYLSDGE